MAASSEASPDAPVVELEAIRASQAAQIAAFAASQRASAETCQEAQRRLQALDAAQDTIDRLAVSLAAPASWGQVGSGRGADSAWRAYDV